MTTTTSEITNQTLMLFCSKDEMRPGILKPWSENGHTLATDGRILIRVDGERPEYVRKPSDAAPPPTEALFSQFPVDLDTGWQPLPALNPLEKECEYCDNGEHGCSCGDRHLCGHCDGNGKVVDRDATTQIGDSWFADRYLERITKLPNAEVWNGHKDYEPLRFHFDGGIGLLMPLRVP